MFTETGAKYNSATKTWHGPAPAVPLYNPECSIGRIMFNVMKLRPHALALISDSEEATVTYGELLTSCTRIAQYLHELELQADDVIAIIARQTITTVEVLLACWFNATPFHAINPTHEQDLLNGPSQTVCIINSSGTTGPPKAGCISNSTALAMPDFCGFQQSDIIFSFSPIDWLSAILFTVATVMAGATRVITTTPFTPQYLLRLLAKYSITAANVSPTTIASLLQVDRIEQFDFSSVRQVLTGGCILSSSVRSKLRQLLKNSDRQIIKNCYGSTESGGVVTLNWNDDKPSAVGKPMRGYRVKTVDEEGRSLGPGELGEILLYTGRKWNGYYGNPTESAQMQDADLWLHTGDLGYVDEEGDLFVVDRKKDIMKYCNFQVSPQEIEEVIAALPQVAEVCVFGNTNDTEGDRAAAAVVRCPGSQLTELDVMQCVEDKFSVEWKHLHGGVFFMDSLPKSDNGKILRQHVKKAALSR